MKDLYKELNSYVRDYKVISNLVKENLNKLNGKGVDENLTSNVDRVLIHLLMLKYNILDYKELESLRKNLNAEDGRMLYSDRGFVVYDKNKFPENDIVFTCLSEDLLDVLSINYKINLSKDAEVSYEFDYLSVVDDAKHFIETKLTGISGIAVKNANVPNQMYEILLGNPDVFNPIKRKDEYTSNEIELEFISQILSREINNLTKEFGFYLQDDFLVENRLEDSLEMIAVDLSLNASDSDIASIIHNINMFSDTTESLINMSHIKWTLTDLNVIINAFNALYNSKEFSELVSLLTGPKDRLLVQITDYDTDTLVLIYRDKILTLSTEYEDEVVYLKRNHLESKANKIIDIV